MHARAYVMADTFRLNGSYGTVPLLGSPSADPVLTAPIDEAIQLDQKAFDTIELTVDTAVNVSFNGLTEANVVVIKTVGGKVRARFTSADGATQAVPVDSFLAVISLEEPITAIDVTREPGTLTTVKVFLGQGAP